jgi:hypothetical protein
MYFKKKKIAFAVTTMFFFGAEAALWLEAASNNLLI